MLDMPLLAGLITEAGLMEKSLAAMSKSEIEALVTACYSAGAMPGESTRFTSPSISQHGTLIIPFDADPKYHYWKRCGQSIFETLRELGASEETFRRYCSGADEVPF